MNIRVYKSVYPDGGSDYSMKTNDQEDSTDVESVEEIAHLSRRKMASFLEKNFSQATLDFAPFHDIEWMFSFLTPRLCLPLTAAEKKEFWLHFTKAE